MSSLPFKLRVYLGTTLAYGFTRAVTYDYNGKKYYLNEKTGRHEKKEMLLVDNIGSITGATVAAVVVWPSMLGADLARLECAAKGVDHSEYK